jgi:hypothetical protein
MSRVRGCARRSGPPVSSISLDRALAHPHPAPYLENTIGSIRTINHPRGRRYGDRQATGATERWLWNLAVLRAQPLSQPEQVLYHRLIRALPEHIVLAQVQVSRILGVKKGSNFHEWNNRINRLSYDFVVCAKDSTVIAGIELDDKSHEKPSRTSTDERKNKASADAGLRLVRWHVRSLPSEEAIRKELLPTVLPVSPSIQAGASRRSGSAA